MRRSLLTRLSLGFPPAKRLYNAVRSLQAESEQARTLYEQLTDNVSRLSSEFAALRSEDHHRSGGSPLMTMAAVPGDMTSSDINALITQQLQSTALRCLPLLPGEIVIGPDYIYIRGYAGAMDNLTTNIKFFINGIEFNEVNFPVIDNDILAVFSAVPGMGFLVEAKMTEQVLQLKEQRFWRFDISSTGHYVPTKWRQAIHLLNPAFERLPIPPAANIKRVIGDANSTLFLMGGAIIFKNIEHYLSEMNLSWCDFPRILDWGCGSGRVTRYLVAETTNKITGADIDPDNIGWCRDSYPSGRFELVGLRPPTSFEESSFDLVIGVSVMTHLQEADQKSWLAELNRIVRPGGLLFLSVQGPTQYAYNRFPAELYRKVQSLGFLDLSRDGALDDVIEDKDYYRAAMHSRKYIAEVWGRYFDVIEIVDAIAALQDFVVLRRK